MADGQEKGVLKMPDTTTTRGEDLAKHVQWLTEYHFDPAQTQEPLLGFRYAVQREYLHLQSNYQDIRVVENPVYGRTLLLDGVVNTTERDEFTYHEMLAHIPALLHPQPKQALIIGGGDGGLARELLKHQSIARVDLVDLDKQVIEAAKKHLPSTGQAFADPRLHCHCVDGVQFIRNSDLRYDLILVDATDPIGPGLVLYQHSFYQSCREALREDGVFAAQGLSPWLQVQEQQQMFATLKQVWPHLSAYLSTVPTYPGGQWVFALAAKQVLSPMHFDLDRANAISQRCRYYNPAVHQAAFALPNFLAQRLKLAEYSGDQST